MFMNRCFVSLLSRFALSLFVVDFVLLACPQFRFSF